VLSRFSLCFGLGLIAARPIQAALPFEKAADFIDNNCSSCHNDVDKTGGLDLTSLSYDPSDRVNFETWIKVHDKVKNGEMPPKKKKRPEPAELESFINQMSTTLTKSDQAISPRMVARSSAG